MSQRKSHKSRRNPSVDMPRYPPTSVASTQPTLQQIHQENLISDYESDNLGYTSDYPSKPPPAERTNDELNLSVLHRHNPDISSILSIAPFAVIYDFTPLPEPSWSKSGVEGSLFVCQLTPGPFNEDRYITFVLNRRGLDNFQAELREGENAGVEISGEFVIVSYQQQAGHEQEHEQKHTKQRINGIFIYSDGPGTSTEKTRDLNAELMKQLAHQAGLSRKAAEARARHTNGHLKQADSMVDEVSMGGAMTRQMTLQDMFNRQRAEDAAWSVRVHSPNQEQQQQQTQTATNDGGTGPRPQSQGGPPQQDILGDLFRRAGFV